MSSICCLTSQMAERPGKHEQEAEWKVEQPGPEPVLSCRILAAQSRGLACCTAVPPNSQVFKMFCKCMCLRGDERQGTFPCARCQGWSKLKSGT